MYSPVQKCVTRWWNAFPATTRALMLAFSQLLDDQELFNPFAALACKISGLKDARTHLQTVYFPFLQPIFFRCYAFWCQSFLMPVRKRRQRGLKPVLNWANVCTPNILRTLRRTMIRFLIELLVRRIWFGQSKLYFLLNWLVMRCKLRPELAADAQQTAWSKM